MGYKAMRLSNFLILAMCAHSASAAKGLPVGKEAIETENAIAMIKLGCKVVEVGVTWTWWGACKVVSAARSAINYYLPVAQTVCDKAEKGATILRVLDSAVNKKPMPKSTIHLPTIQILEVPKNPFMQHQIDVLTHNNNLLTTSNVGLSSLAKNLGSKVDTLTQQNTIQNTTITQLFTRANTLEAQNTTLKIMAAVFGSVATAATVTTGFFWYKWVKTEAEKKAQEKFARALRPLIGLAKITHKNMQDISNMLHKKLDLPRTDPSIVKHQVFESLVAIARPFCNFFQPATAETNTKRSRFKTHSGTL